MESTKKTNSKTVELVLPTKTSSSQHHKDSKNVKREVDVNSFKFTPSKDSRNVQVSVRGKTNGADKIEINRIIPRVKSNENQIERTQLTPGTSILKQEKTGSLSNQIERTQLAPSKINKQDTIGAAANQIERTQLAPNKMTMNRQEKTGTSSSKTTVEPTSQPVQDHPVEASKQSTTTNGPRNENAKQGLKKKKGRHSIQHIEKLKPATLHFKAFLFNAFHIDQNEKNEKHPSIWEAGGQPLSNEDQELKKNLEEAKHFCLNVCIGTYTTDTYQEACNAGCNYEPVRIWLNATKSRVEDKDISKKTGGMFQRAFFNLAGHVGKMIRVSWSFITSIHGSNPQAKEPTKPQTSLENEIVQQAPQMPLFISLRPTFSQEEEAQKKIETLGTELLSNHFLPKPNSMEDNHLFITNFISAPKIIPILKTEAAKKPVKEEERTDKERNPLVDKELKYVSQWWKEEYETKELMEMDGQLHSQLDLLDCISRKSGFPRWFIALTIFASAIVVLWLCFSLTSPPDDMKVMNTKNLKLETLTDDYNDSDDDDFVPIDKQKLIKQQQQQQQQPQQPQLQPQHDYVNVTLCKV